MLLFFYNLFYVLLSFQSANISTLRLLLCHLHPSLLIYSIFRLYHNPLDLLVIHLLFYDRLASLSVAFLGGLSITLTLQLKLSLLLALLLLSAQLFLFQADLERFQLSQLLVGLFLTLSLFHEVLDTHLHLEFDLNLSCLFIGLLQFEGQLVITL